MESLKSVNSIGFRPASSKFFCSFVKIFVCHFFDNGVVVCLSKRGEDGCLSVFHGSAWTMSLTMEANERECGSSNSLPLRLGAEGASVERGGGAPGGSGGLMGVDAKINIQNGWRFALPLA